MGTLSQQEQALFEALLANPLDPAPRLILADALLERGEPYGEVLLLAAGRGRHRARQQKLLESATADFLAPVVRACDSAAYSGGLLEKATLRRGPPKWLEPAADDVRWGTVRELSVPHETPATLALLPRLPVHWLRTLSVQGGDVLDRVLELGWPLTTLRIGYVRSEQLAALAAHGCLPRLAHLFLHRLASPALGVLRESSVLNRPLASLGFALPYHNLEVWLDAVAGATVERIVFTGNDWHYTVDPREWSWTLTAAHRWASRDAGLRLLRELPKRRRVRYRVHNDGS